MTPEELEAKRGDVRAKKERQAGKAHPDYPYTMTRETPGPYISENIHDHRVLLWPPTKKRSNWSADYASHDGSFSGQMDLGPSGDAHGHMRRMWDELDPGHEVANSSTDIQQMFQGAQRNPGQTSRSREFGDEALKARGLN